MRSSGIAKCFLYFFLLASPLYLQIGGVRASGPGSTPIVLPFTTSWKTSQPRDPLGTTSSGCTSSLVVPGTQTSGFYGLNGPNDIPQLGIVDTNITNWPSRRTTVYGYGPGGEWYMKASGMFGSTNQHGSLMLFDNSGPCFSDYTPPFKLKSHTSLDIWYYHDDVQAGAASKYVMVDAQIYDQWTGQLATLGDFNGNSINGSPKVVDQNGIRLHPAYRGSDPGHTWSLASFNLDIVYNTDPDNWFVLGIWVRFDNTGSSSTGQAVTYFGDMFWTYSVEAHHTYTPPSGASVQGVIFTDTIVEFWLLSKDPQVSTESDMEFKVTVSAWSNATFSYCDGGGTCGRTLAIYPFIFSMSALNPPPPPTVTVFPGPTQSVYVAPSGRNLTSQNAANPALLYDLDLAYTTTEEAVSICALTGFPPCTVASLGMGVFDIAKGVYAILNNSPNNSPSYSWPSSNSFAMSYSSSSAKPNMAQGVAFFLVSGFTGSIPAINMQGNVQSDYTPLSSPVAATSDSESVQVSWSPQSQNPYYAPRIHNAVVCSAPCISLTWDPTLGGPGGMPPANGVTAYNIYRGTTPGGEALLVSIGNVTSYVDYSVVLNMNYYYYVTSTGGVSSGRSFEVGGSTFGGCHLCESPTQ